MKASGQNPKEINRMFAWHFALLIVALFIATESLPFIFGTGHNAKYDWGFIYVSMRFVLLPVACFAHAGVNIYRIVKSRKEPLPIQQLSSMVISIGYLISLYFYPLPLTAWK